MMSKQHPAPELQPLESAHLRDSAPDAAGVEATPHLDMNKHGGEQDHAQALTWPEALRIVFVALSAVAVGLRLWEPFSAFSLIGLVGIVLGGWPIFAQALENILARRMTMELSMAIAIVAAAAIGQFFTALVITLFVLVAEVLENLTVSRGRTAIRELLDFLPQSVIVRRDGGMREIPAATLVVGDVVLVNPGGRIPVDGTITSGYSFVDQSRITGESLPVEKLAGRQVPTGSIAQSHTGPDRAKPRSSTVFTDMGRA
jgi:cation transport ATPase